MLLGKTQGKTQDTHIFPLRSERGNRISFPAGALQPSRRRVTSPIDLQAGMDIDRPSRSFPACSGIGAAPEVMGWEWFVLVRGEESTSQALSFEELASPSTG
jgi:hypothetical protein